MSSFSNLDVYSSTGQPVDDLAREAWLLERAAEGRVSVFLTSWEGPVIVLGYAQKAEEADLEICLAEGMPVLRRLTGGTGVIHRGDLGVGLALPLEHPWARGIVGLYGRYLDVLEPALRSLGSDVSRLRDPARASRVRSPVCFLDQLSDTLVVDGKKVVGCAQTRRGGAVLIHAAILLGLSVCRLMRFGRGLLPRCQGPIGDRLVTQSWRDSATPSGWKRNVFRWSRFLIGFSSPTECPAGPRCRSVSRVSGRKSEIRNPKSEIGHGLGLGM